MRKRRTEKPPINSRYEGSRYETPREKTVSDYQTDKRLSTSPKFELKSRFQRDACRDIKCSDITALIGLAGSGKTLMAIYTGMQLLKSQESSIKKIIIVRLAEESMGEKIGALPGELNEKLSYMVGPILDNLAHFLSPTEIKKLLLDEIIEVVPVSHLRGRSLSNTFILVEEVQNMDKNMVLTILTRIASGSKIVFTGDPAQMDFRGRNGIFFLEDMLKDIDGCTIIDTPNSEIYRHPIISSLLDRARELDPQIHAA